MVKKKSIDEFLSSKRLAVVGASRSERKFGNSAFKELKAKGYSVYPVNPYAKTISGEDCYSSLSELRGKVDGALVAVKPEQSEKVVREAASAGIRRIWLQQGSESDAAIRFCEEYGLNVVYGQCILMFAEPSAFFHRMHKGVNKIFGKLPK